MHQTIVHDAALRGRFAQEARASATIKSAHVVAVLDAGVDNTTGVPFLVMELLRGEELGDMITRVGRLPASEVVRFLKQAARALDKAHGVGIIHRDLKPENLFLALPLAEDEEGEPKIKILDFGIAKFLQSTSGAATQSSGTPLYMAPEQTSRSRQIGPGTDVWALGLIAYTLLVGRSYWEADTAYELFGEIMSATRAPASERAAASGVALPGAFDAWLAQCLDADPAKRFDRAGLAIDELAVVLSGYEGSLPNNPAPQPMLPSATVAMPPQRSSNLERTEIAGGVNVRGAALKEKSVTSGATVQVDTAIVRDAPSTGGQPIGRLPRGTKVTTMGTSANWFHIKFGENDAQEGWVFRTSIGR